MSDQAESSDDRSFTCCQMECGESATAEVHHQCPSPECVTHACDRHVGELLGCIVGRDDIKEYALWDVTIEVAV